MELLGYISTADVNSLIQIYPNLPSDTSEKAYRLRFMRWKCPTLPKEFDALYMGDEIEVKKRVNALIMSAIKRPILTYMNAIMIILFYDNHLSEEDLVKYLSAYKTNIIKRWIDVDFTTKDAFIGVPSKRDFQKYRGHYKTVRMRRDLYNKGFLRVLAKVLYLAGDTEDEHKYQFAHSYSYYYIYGVIHGLAANDGRKIETVNYLGNKYEASLYTKEIPAFFQTITSQKFGEKVIHRKASNYGGKGLEKYTYVIREIFEPFLIDPRGLEIAARSLYGAVPEIRDNIEEILEKISYNEEWKTKIADKIRENYHE